MPHSSRLAEPLPWFPWQPLQWQADRLVQKMNWAERGLVRELMDECYLRGSVPSDPQDLANHLAVDLEEIHGLLPKALRHFIVGNEEGRLVCPWIEQIRAKQDEARQKQAIKRLKDPPLMSKSPQITTVIQGPGEERREIGKGKERDEIEREDSPGGACAESAAPPSAQEDASLILSLPCAGNGPRNWPITPELMVQWSEAFPGVHLASEVKKMELWLQQNPRRRKTYDGMPRFTMSWLSKAQNQGNPSRETKGTAGAVADSALSEQLNEINWKGEGDAS